ncbi:hypothetical protein ACX3YG_06350 [Pseudomonas wadenswilerensis]
MDVRTIALSLGVNPDSVLDYQQQGGVDILRIDLAKEPGLRRSIEQRSAAKRLPDGDVFETDCTVEGVARTYQAESMDKYRSYEFVDSGPGEPRIPGWRLRAQVFSPNSLYGAVIEYISFFVFDRHSGSTTYDLSLPNEKLERPWMMYALGYLNEIGQLQIIGVNPRSGNLEVNHVETGENRMDLSAAFARIHFEMPDISEHFPAAPPRGFLFYLPTGFYQLTGTW